MKDKVELIKAKVEEKINLYERLLNAGKGGGAGLMSKIVALQGVLIDINFIQIDSLPEEPVSKDLEEAAEEYSFNIQSLLFDTLGNAQQKLWKPEVENAFKAGAKWDRKKVIDKAVTWLDENLINYWSQVCTDNCDFIEDFKKALEED